MPGSQECSANAQDVSTRDTSKQTSRNIAGPQGTVGPTTGEKGVDLQKSRPTRIRSIGTTRKGVDLLLPSAINNKGVDLQKSRPTRTRSAGTPRKGVDLLLPSAVIGLQEGTGTSGIGVDLRSPDMINSYPQINFNHRSAANTTIVNTTPRLPMKQPGDVDFTNQSSAIFWNCSHGLINKLDFIKSVIAKLKPLLFFICEAEIEYNDQVSACSIDGYTLEVSGGLNIGKARTCCYVLDNIGMERVHELEGGNSIEVMTFDNPRLKTRFLGFYNPFKIPEGTTRKQYQRTLLDTLGTASVTQYKFIAAGDMNIDLMKANNTSREHHIWLIDYGLTQHVKCITRHRQINLGNGATRIEASLLDHVYSNADDIQHEIIPTDCSDHDMLLVGVSLHRDLRPLKTKLKIRDWKDYTKEALADTVKSKTITNANYGSILRQTYEYLVPERTCRIKNPEQIINAKLERKKKRRDRLLRKFKKTRQQEIYIEIKTLNKQIRNEFKMECKKRIQNKMSSPDPKAFWTCVNKLLGKSAPKPISLKISGVVITDPKILCQQFQDFFIKKVYGLADIQLHPIQLIKLEPPFVPLVFGFEDLQKMLKKVKRKKCHGTDNIPLLVGKDFAETNPRLCLDIFNNAAANGMPTEWKEARIIPLHKKGDKSNIENYRPISNLNALSKLYEKLLYQKLLEETGGREGKSQHGFRTNHSTVTATLELKTIIADALDEGNTVIVYSIDLSAAFDLLRSDKFYEVIGNDLSEGLGFAIMDFLTGRKITTEVEGHRSNLENLLVGCVQGSTLGPRLFTLYTGWIGENLGADHYICYADDSYVIIIEKDIELAVNRLEAISSTHIARLESLGMKVNPSKTESVIFTKKGTETRSVNINNHLLETKTSMKVLGILFDNNLRWDTQVDSIIKKANSKISVLKKLRSKFTQQQFLQILTSQFFSIIFYCSDVWLTTSTSQKLWTVINSIHYKSLRIAVCDHKQRINREKLDVLCQRANPKQWSKYSSASLVIKVLQREEPSYLVNNLRTTLYFERRSPHIGKFYDNSKGKIGRQKLCNGLQHMAAIRFNWLGLQLGNATIRSSLKKTYFAYLVHPHY